MWDEEETGSERGCATVAGADPGDPAALQGDAWAGGEGGARVGAQVRSEAYRMASSARPLIDGARSLGELAEAVP